ncbi:MAG: SPOR domain-containing protein [Candidatus Omnitrophota bacterium]
MIDRRPQTVDRRPKWIVIVFFFILVCGLWSVVCGPAYALDLDKLKVYYLNGDYKAAITEGEKIMAAQSVASTRSDELYYILGLSYLGDGNYLRASDIFEIILKEFDKSAFKEDARLSLGDAYFLKGDFDLAKTYYQDVVNNNSKLKPLAFYRLSQTALKTGDTESAQKYSQELKEKITSEKEAALEKDIGGELPDFYTVQVGSFGSQQNAKNLNTKLISQGYDAYIQEADMGTRIAYRVKVGKLKSRPEAVQLQLKLSADGYPANIIP